MLFFPERGIDDRSLESGRVGRGYPCALASPPFLPFFLQFAIGSLMDDYLGECLTWVLVLFSEEGVYRRGGNCRI